MDGATFELPKLGKKIAFSTVVQVMGKGITLVLAAISLKLITNYLGTGDYAFYASVFEYALFFSVAANLGIFAQTVRAMSDKPRDGKTFINALALRVATAVVFSLVAMLILLPGSDAIFMTATVLFLGALSFDYITQVCDAMLQANYMMGRATLALILGRTINVGGIVLVTYSLAPEAGVQNIPFIFLASMMGSVVTAGLSLWFVRQKIKWEWKLDKSFIWKLLKVSLPFGIINIFNSLYFRFIPEFLGRTELSAGQFSSFNVSFRIAQVMSVLSTFLMFSVLPGFKHYLERKEWEKAGRVYDKVWKVLAVGGFLLVTLGSLLGPWILQLLTSKQYFLPEFWFLLPMMLLLSAISYGYDLILITLYAFGKDYWLIRREAIAFVLAGSVFVAVPGVVLAQHKVALIVFGAILGETFMVVNGILKIRHMFHAKRQRKFKQPL